MKYIFYGMLLVACLVSAVSYGGIDPNRPALPSDRQGIGMQIFTPDPAKSQVNASMTGTMSLKKGTGGTVNVTGWVIARVVPTADATYYFNSDSTKTYPLFSGMDNLIALDGVATGGSVTLVLGSATASIQGM